MTTNAMHNALNAAYGIGLQNSTTVRIQGTGSGVDQFRADAIDGFLYTATNGRRGKATKVATQGPQAILHQCLANAGVHRVYDSAIDAAQAVMELAASGINRAGDFPNIMAAVTSVLLDDAATSAEISFPRFAHRLPDATSMDMVSIGGFGMIDGLDAHVDGDDVKEKKLVEESKGYIAPVLYANDVCLTPLMISDPVKFSNFLRAVSAMLTAGNRSLNRAIIQAIATNVKLIDGIDLFHADHANLVSSGNGAPSETTLLLNRERHAEQRAPGSTTKSGVGPSIVLVPDALAPTAQKAFQTHLAFVGGQAVANVDSLQNIFKDRVAVVSDPELDNYSTAYWYSLVDPTIEGLRSIVYRYLAGYGPERQLTTYFDHKKRGLAYSVDFAAGFAITKHRGIVRNNG